MFAGLSLRTDASTCYINRFWCVDLSRFRVGATNKLNAACASAIFTTSLNLDVAIQAPVSAPGVPNQVVVESCLFVGTVADGDDSMIYGNAAVRARNDSTTIVTEKLTL